MFIGFAAIVSLESGSLVLLSIYENEERQNRSIYR